MPEEHEKNSNGQEPKGWAERGVVRKGDGEGDGMRYGEMRGGPRGYFPGPPHPPHSGMMRSNEMGPDAGFHGGGRTQSPSRGSAEDADLSDAMVYLNKIKEEYEDDMVTYDNFLETMRDFKFGKVDAEEVCKAVRVLFKNKPHLIETFNEYLPPHLRFYGERLQEAGARPFERQMALVGPPPQFRRPVYGSGGKHPGMSMGPPPMQMGPGGGMHGGYNGGARVRSPGRMGSVQMGKQGMHQQQKMEELERIKAKQAQEFIQRVKRRYSHRPNVYKTFVELLQTHQAKSNMFEKMKAEVNSLLWESPDLREDFERNFIPIRRQGGGEKDVLQRIKELLKEKNLLEDFLKCINYFNQKFINERDLVLLVEPLLRDRELMKGFKTFINYKEPCRETPRKMERYKKEGSYRILGEQVSNERQDAVAREVLNTMCISCPTFESEDSNYVFLKRNIHEEALFRVEDERSEADLVTERIQYFISRLEQVLGTNEGGEISMKDLRMSPGIVKEVLRSVYERSAPEILEGILTKPQIAIPVVIKRLYTVNKRLRLCLREKRKIWREVMERNHRKALDVVGPGYKTAEKSIFTARNVVEAGDRGLRCVMEDHGVIDDVRLLCDVYVRTGQTASRRSGMPDGCSTLDLVFETLRMDEFGFVSDFPVLCVFRFIMLVYERLLEIKRMELPAMRSSETAVSIEQQEEINVEDRYSAVREACVDFMRKTIDGYMFEDRIRELTECKGFRLYNLKKMVSKIERQMMAIAENEASVDSLRGRNNFEAGEELYYFRKAEDVVEIRAVGLERDDGWDEYMEKFRMLDLCPDVKPGCPFLPRVCKRPPIIGYLKQNLRMQLCPGTYKITHVAGCESLYVRLGARSRRM